VEFKFRFLTTGIGSFPHKTPGEALNLTLKYFSIPFWPQLPKRDPKENMILQFTENLRFLNLKGKDLFLDISQDFSSKLAEVLEKIESKDIEFFSLRREYAEGLWLFLEKLKESKFSDIQFIKGQVTGPFTLAGSIKTKEQSSIFSDEDIMTAIVGSLQMKALWQIRKFKEYRKSVILFFDEPYLGSFGSAFSPLTEEIILKWLSKLILPLKEKDVILGIHCCSNTDWSLLMKTDFDILSFDAYAFIDNLLLYSKELKEFLKRGGILSWGIVPTTEFRDQSPEELIEKLEKAIDKLIEKGIPKELILENSLLTPSCGLGYLSIENSKKISKTLYLVSEILREKYFYKNETYKFDKSI
jgi:methionine synthase II (cobalamin-independent)